MAFSHSCTFRLAAVILACLAKASCAFNPCGPGVPFLASSAISAGLHAAVYQQGRLGLPRLEVYRCRFPGSPLSAKEIKERLRAAGISTAGIMEKEELVRLLNEHEASVGDATSSVAAETSPVGDETSPLTVPLVVMDGSVYAEIDADDGSLVRLLVDTGAAISICSSAVAQRLGQVAKVTLRSLQRAPGLALLCRVAPQTYILPNGVDGILGFDVLSTFKAVELDWSAQVVRFHRVPIDLAQGSSTSATLPITTRRVSAGTLPFIRAAFGSAPPCDAVLDSGSPVTMVTPELCEQGGDSMTADNPDDDIISTGVDGQPTRMRATNCKSVMLVGDKPVLRQQSRVYAGTGPMMVMVGWAGKPAALIGLDLLRPQGGTGKTVVNWERGEVQIE